MKSDRKWARRLAISVVAAGVSGAPHAQVVLGHHYRAHYWDLPTEFDQSFNYLGQTALYQSSSKVFDASGNRHDTGTPTNEWFGFTIFSHFFKFDPASKWAFAASLSTYELSLRSGDFSLHGVGSAIPSFTGWTKPSSNSTVGFDLLAATPFSVSSKLDSHLWDLYARGFYDVNIGNVNVDTVLGYHTAIRQSDSVAKPPDEYHVNTRIGYDFKNVAAAGWRVTPYLAADYQRTWGNAFNVLNLGLGVAVSHKNGVTWSLGWSKSAIGKNMPETNAVLAQIWVPL